MAKTYEDVKLLCDRQGRSLAIQPEDYKRLREEIKEIMKSLPDGPSSSIQELSNDIDKTQVVKDRLIEIFADSQDNNSARKKIAELMLEAASANSGESSMDKRKASGAVMAAEYVLAAAEADGFQRYCLTFMKNLDSRHEAKSRMITCISLTMRIGDSGRESMMSSMAVPRDTSGVFDDMKIQADSGDKAGGEISF
jgi:hypothetical protein